MAKVHEVAIGADGRAFDQGIRSGVIKPTEDAVKALGKLEDAASDTGRDGARDLDRLEDSLKDVQRQSEKTERSMDDIGDGGRVSMDKVKAGAQEVTSEIGSNLGEAVSSIRGDLGDLGQVGQDTLGGLAATLASTGPAGIAGAAVLAAGAVGLGAITAEFQKQQEEAEALRARMTDIYQAAAEAGVEYLSTAALIADANDVMYNTERADEYKRLQDTQKQTGLDMSTILMANAGELDAIETVQGRINKLIEEERTARRESGVGDNYGRDLQSIEDHWKAVGDEATLQSGKTAEAIQYTSDILLKAAADAGTATEQVDKFGNRLLTLPTGEQIVIDAETGQAHQDLDRFEQDADALEKTVTTTAVFDDRQARIDYAAFRASVTQRLGIPTTLAAPSGIAKWD